MLDFMLEPPDSPAAMTVKDSDEGGDPAMWTGWGVALQLLLPCALGVVLASCMATSPWLALGLAILAAAMSFGAGWVVGFLFGLPKLANSTMQERFRGNTNLELISDWLPQVLFGVGVAELAQVRDGIGRISEFVSVSSGLNAFACSATIVICVFAGLIRGFLVTRLFLHQAMATADNKAGVLAIGHKDKDDPTKVPSEGPKTQRIESATPSLHLDPDPSLTDKTGVLKTDIKGGDIVIIGPRHPPTATLDPKQAEVSSEGPNTQGPGPSTVHVGPDPSRSPSAPGDPT